jgi:hypothetical protein
MCQTPDPAPAAHANSSAVYRSSSVRCSPDTPRGPLPRIPPAAGGNIGESRPQAVLLLVIDQDEKAAIVVVKRVDAHLFSKPPSRNEWNQTPPEANRAGGDFGKVPDRGGQNSASHASCWDVMVSMAGYLSLSVRSAESVRAARCSHLIAWCRSRCDGHVLKSLQPGVSRLTWRLVYARCGMRRS